VAEKQTIIYNELLRDAHLLMYNMRLEEATGIAGKEISAS
jgi:hypothetical protein